MIEQQLTTALTELVGIRHPVVQTGMGWVAGPRLVSGTANAGGLGILASATMTFEELERAILEVKGRTEQPFGVNLRADADRPARLGDYLPWLVKEHTDLDIRILKWGLSWVQFLKRGRMAYDIARMWMVDGISFRFDSHHPTGCSHHQKIVVIDESLAACGGIDITSRRWDTPDHKPDDERRKTPNGNDYKPWHDTTMLLRGPIARTLGELGRERWKVATSKDIDPIEDG